MGIQVGLLFILGTATAIRTFLKKSVLVLMQITRRWSNIHRSVQAENRETCLPYLQCSILIHLNFVVKSILNILYQSPFPLPNENNLYWFRFLSNWQDCSQEKLARLFPSDTGTIVSKWYWHNFPKWHRHNCSQVRLAQFSQVTRAQLFTSKTGTIVPKWDWPSCSQVTLARLFASETGTIVLKWDQQGCSEVTLAPLFPSGFWISTLYFVLQFFLWHDSSPVSFTWEELCHVPGFVRERYLAGFQYTFPRESLTRK